MIHVGDALEVLKTLPDKLVNMVMTSPPYWALRDYGVEGQLGGESSYGQYVLNLCNIFDEVKRVLRDDGVCFVNIGDTYGGIGDKGEHRDPKNAKGRNGQKVALNKSAPSKCLLQIPNRFAIEMCDRGWVLRNEIIWYRGNQMPSSVKDRFTVDFEKIFMFTKGRKYYFEQQFEALSAGSDVAYRNKLRKGKTYDLKEPYANNMPASFDETKRNKRCVWSINTKPYKGGHIATYPEELCEVPILAGCPVGGIVLDPFCGAATTGVVAKRLGREFIGIELNGEYAEEARKRLKTF